jgi:hypothetical protein
LVEISQTHAPAIAAGAWSGSNFAIADAAPPDECAAGLGFIAATACCF